MAKVQPGPLTGRVSGSIGATVFSHNRYGAYIRARSVPTISTTTYALNAKARLSAKTAEFRDLTPAQRLSWQEWANQNPIVGPLGDTQILTGHAAYVALNVRLDLLPTPTTIDVPPIVPAPAALTTLSLTGDIGAGSVTAVYTPTPVGAALHVYLQAALVNSASINYIRNYLRLVAVSAANQASPYDIESVLAARLGTITVGQILHVQASVLDGATGLLSPPLRAKVTITTT